MENENVNADTSNSENENANSQNSDVATIEENDDVTVLKEKYQKLTDTNRQLFERAKKAEGFEKNTEGKWVKTQKPKTEVKTEVLKKSDEIDLGHLAFYNSKSDSVKIEADEDVEFLQSTIKETGKTQKTLLGSKWFQSELKERQEARSVLKATPGATRTAGEPASTKVDYWINKGQLPPDQKLREDVVNEKIRRARSSQGL
jgi:hypothetical protein